MRIVVVASLPDFLAEAPPPRLARLHLQTNSGGQARLDLQALAASNLIWLCDWYGRSAPPEVHYQLPAARAAVAGWLAAQGYEVRPGRWATPVGLRPLRGWLVQWRETDKGYKLESPG